MSRTTFTIAYDGPALREGLMDVRDLAPALLAVGRLFDAANLTLNGDSAKVSVQVRATTAGSFEIVLELFQSLGQQVVELLTGSAVTAVLNLKELILIGGAGGFSLFWLIKKLKGRKPDKLERISPETVRVTFEGETFEIPMKLLRLYQDIEVRAAAEKVVLVPLRNPSIETFEVREQGRKVVTVTRTEAELFVSPEMAEITLTEGKSLKAFSIVSLAFKEDNKWRLHDGNTQISALIADENFLRRVDASEVSFSKGDILICEVKITQRQAKDGLKTEYVVERVVDHKSPPRQIQMNFSDDRPSQTI
ncbi:MAG TPA: hypothetical protein DCL54_14975 [Alphaproteobacteria bacterium]|nr:hypothetical protein [Alphaproteobacteria bacterium]HAJ47875.1 hypothetical protein [Alphaproteobacteria bacterium]